ncbi:MAG: hypothetical protein E7167_00180 [Firmicutes bacterium]|nr:hypothetical protein [Bacillota bacterium]
MSNKKRYIIVLVLLLFIGLGIFTFAAPSGDDGEGNGGTTNNNVAIEPDGNVDNNTTVNNNVTNTNPTVNNQNNVNNNNRNENIINDNNGAGDNTGAEDEPALSDAYKAALAAVEKAEGSLEDEDYKTAMGMVSGLTEEDTTDLEERLNTVNNFIVAALVEELKTQTNGALDEEDAKALEDARDYRTENDIIARVDALDNDLEDVLKYILEELAKVLDDTNGPEFNIEDGALLNSLTGIEVEDSEENEIISLILVDEEGKETEFNEETEVADGTYTLVATDAALNESKVTFTLDTTAAKRVSANMYANGYLNEYQKDNKTYKDYYVNDENTITAYIRTNEQLKAVPTITFHINGKDYVAENVMESFHNKTDEENGVYKYQTTIVVGDLASEESGEIDFTVSNIIDLAGNTSNNVEGVSNLNSVYLDKTAPNMQVGDVIYTPEDTELIYSNTRFRAEALDELSGISEIYANGKLRDKIDVNGESTYTFKLVDNVGNVAEYKVMVDKTAPSMQVGDVVYTPDHTEIIYSNTRFKANAVDTLSGVSEIYANGKLRDKIDVNGESTYTFKLVDKAGNVAEYKVIVDKTAPGVDSLRILAHDSVMGDGYVRYTNNGDRVLVYLTLNERAYNVTATINGVAMDTFSDKVNEDGTHSFTFEYYVKEGDGLADGMATFEFKGHDIAGNEFTYTEADGTLGSQKWIYIDRTSPVADSLRILAHGSVMGDGYVRYTNNGDRVLVYLTLNERAYDVTATINGVAMDTFSDKVNEDGTHSFTFEYYVKEGDGLEDGLAKFEFKGHDLAGNGFTFTEADGKLGSQKWIYIDRTAPAVSTLRLTSHGSVMGDGYIHYSNNGDRVIVYLTLNDVAYDVTATINGLAMNNFSDKINEDGSHSFTFDYTIKEGDGLADGLAKFEFKGHDFTGNTFTYTEADGTLGSQKWIYIDRTAPVVDDVRLATSRGISTDGTQTWYATNGDTIYAYIELSEKLGTLPTLSINDGAVVVPFTKEIVENGIYTYEASYLVTENDALVDGLITIDINGYTDVTGNLGAALDETNIKLDGHRRVVIDKTGPQATSSSAIGNIPKSENGENNWYVTDGNTVQVYARFAEELKDLPVLYINGKKIATLSTKTKIEGGYSYSVWYKVDSQKDGLEDGTFTIEIKDYTDFLGNVGKTITKENMTKGQRVITLDTKGPEVVSFATYGGTAVRENGENNWYIKDGETLRANLVLKEKSEATPVLIVNDKEVATFRYVKEDAGKVYYSTTYVMGSNDDFADGLLNIKADGYTDFLGNKGAQPTKSQLLAGQRVVTLYSTADQTANATVSLGKDITLLDEPFYNVNENTEAVTINGNGHTVKQIVTSEDKFNFIENGTRTTMGNMFSSSNGSKLTINNLTFEGTTQTISLGQYKAGDATVQSNFNSELYNVNVVGLNVVSFGNNYLGQQPGIAPAVIVYGNATINNSNIYGTKRSNLETGPNWDIYDLAVVNYTSTNINHSKIGSIYTWTHAGLVINNSKVDAIYTAARATKGGIVVEAGSTIGKIVAHPNAKLVITIKAGATVDTIDLTATDSTTCTITIEEGAIVNNIITE